MGVEIQTRFIPVVNCAHKSPPEFLVHLPDGKLVGGNYDNFICPSVKKPITPPNTEIDQEGIVEVFCNAACPWRRIRER